MSVNISFHPWTSGNSKLVARSNVKDGWVEIKTDEGDYVTYFLHDGEYANALAAAINSVPYPVGATEC